MKFKNNRAWVLAMDEIQGNTPDPSPFRPAEANEAERTAHRPTTRGSDSGVVMKASSGSPAKGLSAPGSSRNGNGGGSMSC